MTYKLNYVKYSPSKTVVFERSVQAQRKSAVSPLCEFNFRAACARSTEIAASARLAVPQCGEETGHLNRPQRVGNGQFTFRTWLPLEPFVPQVSFQENRWPNRRDKAQLNVLRTILQANTGPTTQQLYCRLTAHLPTMPRLKFGRGVLGCPEAPNYPRPANPDTQLP
jgi:hypothetical protein